MKNSQMTSWVRGLLFLCCILLVVVLFVPMWRIDLDAPQYPEGLRLLIFPNKIAGDVDIINGLNHYIGMKTMHTKDFFEFTILPYLIGFFAALCFLVAVLGKRKFLNILFAMFICFGIVAMIDFWKWEYDYGHNLNPDAAIIVPGMAYQPPLIGFKQLLNFGAYSVPDIGGWLFVAVGIILSLAVFVEFRNHKKSKSGVVAIAFMLMIMTLNSCNTKPEDIVIGKDICGYCKMAISDARFGAEAITKKGKIYKYDELHCLLSDIEEKGIDKQDIKEIYLTDYCGTHQLILCNSAFFLNSEELKSPMGGNIAAFANEDSLNNCNQFFDGKKMSWNEIMK